MSSPTPEILTLQVCERVIRDEMTKQVSVIGLLDQLVAKRYPTTMYRLLVFLEMSGGHGMTALEIRMVDADELRPPVFSMMFQVMFDDPNAVTRVPLEVQGSTVPEPGEYRVQVLCQGAILRQRRLTMNVGPTVPGR